MAADRKPIRELIPVWLAASLGALVLAAGFLFMRGGANAEVAEIRQAVSQLPLREAIVIEGTEPEEGEEPIIVAVPVVDQVVLDAVCSELTDEAAAGLVECTGEPGFVTVRILGDNMFSPGRATVKGSIQQTVRLVGATLDPFARDDVRIDVLGYTDSTPMRRGANYSDNFELSEARARAVANLLRNVVSDPSRLHVEGRGAQNIIRTVDGAEDFARSRRVELRLVKETSR